MIIKSSALNNNKLTKMIFCQKNFKTNKVIISNSSNNGGKTKSLVLKIVMNNLEENMIEKNIQ